MVSLFYVKRIAVCGDLTDLAPRALSTLGHSVSILVILWQGKYERRVYQVSTEDLPKTDEVE